MTNNLPTAGQEPNDYLIPVAFDVNAPTRKDAVRILADLLGDCRERLLGMRPEVESWWFPEAQDKDVDSNDRPDMRLVDHEPGTLRDVADALPGAWYSPRDTAPTVVQQVGKHQVIVSDWDMQQHGMAFIIVLHHEGTEPRFAEAPDAAAAAAFARQFARAARTEASSEGRRGSAA